MIFKYHLSLNGNSFYPENILDKIQGDFTVMSFFSPRDKKPDSNSEEFGFGCISLWHPKKFSTEYNLRDYQNDFITFIRKNYSLLAENGLEEIDIYMEIYFDGGQCNFEIFTKDLLRSISNFNLSLPISVYVLPKKEIKKWEMEISQAWQTK